MVTKSGLSTTHGLTFALLWLIKNAGSLWVILFPILIGHNQSTTLSYGQKATLTGLSLGLLLINQVLSSSPSAEHFVVANIFLAWLSNTLLIWFKTPLQTWLHQFSFKQRRCSLWGISGLLIGLMLVGHTTWLGFSQGTSWLWFSFLFAWGDYLAQAKLNWWHNHRFILGCLVILSFLGMSLVTWMSQNPVAYSPHQGLVLTFHYANALPIFTPLALTTAFLISVNLPTRFEPSPTFLISGNLLLTWLAIPNLLFLLHRLPFILLVVTYYLLWASLSWLILQFGNQLRRPKFTFNWLKHLQPWIIPALIFGITIWGLTIISFGFLWDWRLPMLQWVVIHQAKLVTINCLIVGAFAGLLMALTNRWWLSSGLTILVYAGWLVASGLKITARQEPILPTDLSTLSAPQEMLSMVNPLILISAGIIIIVVLIGLIWLERYRGTTRRFNWFTRILSLILAGGYLLSFTHINHPNSLSHHYVDQAGDIPYFYDQLRGAKVNGTLLQFMNNVDVTVMDKPAGYSKHQMEVIENRYLIAAQQLNLHRSHRHLGKQRLVFILSESFANPRRVPGLEVHPNPTPYLDKLKATTPSGLMLSTGYGGGTANMEYQALTGLSVVNFSPTLPTPYSQLVPFQHHPVTINQLFTYSAGIHPFTANLYNRKEDYQKFGFNSFYYLGSRYHLRYHHHLGTSPRIDDWSAYQQILWQLQKKHGNQFIQVATMQNHMPYNNYYHPNHFQVSGSTAQGDDHTAIQTYTQGVNYTDQALQKFIGRLQKSSQPTTVVWYGDHLPGIYHQVSMQSHGLVMHETDYFIYSNPAAQRLNHSRVTKTKVVSPNEFPAMALAQMDMQVTPYYALLTKVHEQLPAITLTLNQVSHSNRIHENTAELIDQHGHQVQHLSKAQRQLYHDYQLVQYDLTAGHHYLLHDRFIKTIPPRVGRWKSSLTAWLG